VAVEDHSIQDIPWLTPKSSHGRRNVMRIFSTHVFFNKLPSSIERTAVRHTQILLTSS
jgi:hypothetical protein